MSDFSFLPSNFSSETPEQADSQRSSASTPASASQQRKGKQRRDTALDALQEEEGDFDDDEFEAQIHSSDAALMPPPPPPPSGQDRLSELEDEEAMEEGEEAMEEEEEEEEELMEVPKKRVTKRDERRAVFASGTAAEVKQLEAERLRQLYSQFTDEQLSRYEAYKSSNFNEKKITSVMSGLTNSSINKNMGVAMRGILKIYVGELVEMSRVVMSERGDYGPIRPSHLREAYRRLKAQGKVPETGVNGNVLQRSSGTRRKFRRM